LDKDPFAAIWNGVELPQHLRRALKRGIEYTEHIVQEHSVPKLTKEYVREDDARQMLTASLVSAASLMTTSDKFPSRQERTLSVRRSLGMISRLNKSLNKKFRKLKSELNLPDKPSRGYLNKALSGPYVHHKVDPAAFERLIAKMPLQYSHEGKPIPNFDVELYSSTLKRRTNCNSNWVHRLILLK